MRRRLAVLGIVAFVIVDAGLIALALRHGGVDPQSEDVIVTRTVISTPAASSPAETTRTTRDRQPASQQSTSDADETSTSVSGATRVTSSGVSGTSTSTSAGFTPVSRTLLDMSSDGAAIRATVGDCAGEKPGSVEVSTDAGQSWIAAGGQLGQVLRVSARSGGDLWFAGADTDCAPARYESPDFADPLPISDYAVWYLIPEPSGGTADDRPTTVASPSGVVETGCPVVGLAPVDQATTYVLCADGTIRRTQDAGATWLLPSPVAGVVSISFTDTDTGFALARQSDCPAAVLATTDQGAQWSTVACLEGERPQAIAVADDRLLAMVDESMQASDDAGVSWRRLE